MNHLRHFGAVLIAALAVTFDVSAQSVREMRERLATGLGPIDDVEVMSDGRIIISLPTAGMVAFLDLPATLTPIVNATVFGMALEPGERALWIGDFGLGTLRRIDLQTFQVSHTLSGFNHPLEIEFATQETMIVGSIDTPDFHTGFGRLYTVTAMPSLGTVTVVQAVSGIAGGMDVAFNAEGRLFLNALGSLTVDEILLPSNQVVPLVSPVIQGTDLLRGPGNSVFVSTIFAGQIFRVNPDPLAATSTSIVALLPGVLGAGCEDLALTPDGDLLVSCTNGELWKFLVNAPLLQEGIALAGFPFGLRLNVPALAGSGYIIAGAFSLGPPLHLPGTTEFFLPATDLLFYASLDPNSGLMAGGQGTLDSQGRGSATVFFPPLPPATVLDLYFGAILFQNSQILAAPDPIHIVTFAL